jgi:hypothetical protein
MSMDTITVRQWSLVREWAMRAILERETDMLENPEDFGAEGLAASNAELDEVRGIIRTLDKGSTRIVLGPPRSRSEERRP